MCRGFLLFECWGILPGYFWRIFLGSFPPRAWGEKHRRENTPKSPAAPQKIGKHPFRQKPSLIISEFLALRVRHTTAYLQCERSWHLLSNVPGHHELQSAIITQKTSAAILLKLRPQNFSLEESLESLKSLEHLENGQILLCFPQSGGSLESLESPNSQIIL